MIHKYFEDYHGSDEKLKETIYYIIEQLTHFFPDHFNYELLELANPQNPTETFIKNLKSRIPNFEETSNSFKFLNLNQRLTLIATHLDSILNIKMVEKLVCSIAFTKFSTHFLAYKYVIATEFIERRLNQSLQYDRDKLTKTLLDPRGHTNNLGENPYYALEAADEEMNRILNDSTHRQDYIDLVKKFESSFEYDFKKQFSQILFESIERLFMELIAEKVNIISANLNISEYFTSQDKKEVGAISRKIASKGISLRMGVKQGGARKTQKFVWNDEHKIKFFETIETLPQIKGIPMWDYAFDSLNDTDFNYKIIDYLRSDTVFKSVPQSLFQKAVRTWRRYENSFSVPKPEEKPRAFAYQYALFLLKFPETKYSSLNKYYGMGKKLFKINNLSIENSK